MAKDQSLTRVLDLCSIRYKMLENFLLRVKLFDPGYLALLLVFIYEYVERKSDLVCFSRRYFRLYNSKLFLIIKDFGFES